MNAPLQSGFSSGKPSLPAAPVDWLDVLPPQADCLRSYQREQLAKVAGAMHAGYRRILVQLPTGGGKTHEIATMVVAATLAGLRVLILATRTRLVRQLHERLLAFEVRHGVVAAPLPELLDYSACVQIASVDTLHRRAVVDERIPLPGADLVIFDEGHLSASETRLRILQSYPAAVRIGFTATPARKSGRSLGAAFDCLIQGPTVRELTAAGTLVPLRIFNTPVVTQKELGALPKDTDQRLRHGCPRRAARSAKAGRGCGQQLAADRERQANAGLRGEQSACQRTAGFVPAARPSRRSS